MAKIKHRDSRSYPNPFFNRPQNLAWRKNLRALSEDWKAGEISNEEFFEAVLDEASPATARESLQVIGEKAANYFDHWFAAVHGSSFNLDKRDEEYYSWHGGFESYLRGKAEWYRRRRVIEAFHRAVLDRREPI